MRRSEKKRGLLCLWMSLCGFFLMSISFMLMPVESAHMVSDLLFWSGLIIGVVCQIVLEARRRAFFSKYNVKREKMQKPKNGLLTFGSNRIAMVADTFLVASAIMTIITFVFTKGYGYLCYACIAVLLFSFCMHCVFNGRNYFHANNQNKIRQVLEQKKANTLDKGEGENGKS